MFGTLVMWLVFAGATLVIVSVVLEGLFAVHDAIGAGKVQPALEPDPRTAVTSDVRRLPVE